jgi:hypothetical protein
MLPSLKQCKYKNIKIHKLFSNLKETGESDLEEKVPPCWSISNNILPILRSAELLFQGVHTETMWSIPDDGKKYGYWTLGSTHDGNGKYT